MFSSDLAKICTHVFLSLLVRYDYKAVLDNFSPWGDFFSRYKVTFNLKLLKHRDYSQLVLNVSLSLSFGNGISFTHFNVAHNALIANYKILFLSLSGFLITL